MLNKMLKEDILKSEKVKDHFGKLLMILMILKISKKYKKLLETNNLIILHSETLKFNSSLMKKETQLTFIHKLKEYEQRKFHIKSKRLLCYTFYKKKDTYFFIQSLINIF